MSGADNQCRAMTCLWVIAKLSKSKIDNSWVANFRHLNAQMESSDLGQMMTLQVVGNLRWFILLFVAVDFLGVWRGTEELFTSKEEEEEEGEAEGGRMAVIACKAAA